MRILLITLCGLFVGSLGTALTQHQRTEITDKAVITDCTHKWIDRVIGTLSGYTYVSVHDRLPREDPEGAAAAPNFLRSLIRDDNSEAARDPCGSATTHPPMFISHGDAQRLVHDVLATRFPTRHASEEFARAHVARNILEFMPAKTTLYARLLMNLIDVDIIWTKFDIFCPRLVAAASTPRRQSPPHTPKEDVLALANMDVPGPTASHPTATHNYLPAVYVFLNKLVMCPRGTSNHPIPDVATVKLYSPRPMSLSEYVELETEARLRAQVEEAAAATIHERTEEEVSAASAADSATLHDAAAAISVDDPPSSSIDPVSPPESAVGADAAIPHSVMDAGGASPAVVAFDDPAAPANAAVVPVARRAPPPPPPRPSHPSPQRDLSASNADDGVSPQSERALVESPMLSSPAEHSDVLLAENRRPVVDPTTELGVSDGSVIGAAPVIQPAGVTVPDAVPGRRDDHLKFRDFSLASADSDPVGPPPPPRKTAPLANVVKAITGFFRGSPSGVDTKGHVVNPLPEAIRKHQSALVSDDDNFRLTVSGRGAGEPAGTTATSTIGDVQQQVDFVPPVNENVASLPAPPPVAPNELAQTQSDGSGPAMSGPHAATTLASGERTADAPESARKRRETTQRKYGESMLTLGASRKVFARKLFAPTLSSEVAPVQRSAASDDGASAVAESSGATQAQDFSQPASEDPVAIVDPNEDPSPLVVGAGPEAALDAPQPVVPPTTGTRARVNSMLARRASMDHAAPAGKSGLGGMSPHRRRMSAGDIQSPIVASTLGGDADGGAELPPISEKRLPIAQVGATRHRVRPRGGADPEKPASDALEYFVQSPRGASGTTAGAVGSTAVTGDGDPAESIGYVDTGSTTVSTGIGAADAATIPRGRSSVSTSDESPVVHVVNPAFHAIRSRRGGEGAGSASGAANPVSSLNARDDGAASGIEDDIAPTLAESGAATPHVRWMVDDKTKATILAMAVVESCTGSWPDMIIEALKKFEAITSDSDTTPVGSEFSRIVEELSSEPSKRCGSVADHPPMYISETRSSYIIKQFLVQLAKGDAAVPVQLAKVVWEHMPARTKLFARLLMNLIDSNVLQSAWPAVCMPEPHPAYLSPTDLLVESPKVPLNPFGTKNALVSLYIFLKKLSACGTDPSPSSTEISPITMEQYRTELAALDASNSATMAASLANQVLPIHPAPVPHDRDGGVQTAADGTTTVVATAPSFRNGQQLPPLNAREWMGPAARARLEASGTEMGKDKRWPGLTVAEPATRRTRDSAVDVQVLNPGESAGSADGVVANAVSDIGESHMPHPPPPPAGSSAIAHAQMANTDIVSHHHLTPVVPALDNDDKISDPVLGSLNTVPLSLHPGRTTGSGSSLPASPVVDAASPVDAAGSDGAVIVVSSPASERAKHTSSMNALWNTEIAVVKKPHAQERAIGENEKLLLKQQGKRPNSRTSRRGRKGEMGAAVRRVDRTAAGVAGSELSGDASTPAAEAPVASVGGAALARDAASLSSADGIMSGDVSSPVEPAVHADSATREIFPVGGGADSGQAAGDSTFMIGDPASLAAGAAGPSGASAGDGAMGDNAVLPVAAPATGDGTALVDTMIHAVKPPAKMTTAVVSCADKWAERVSYAVRYYHPSQVGGLLDPILMKPGSGPHANCGPISDHPPMFITERDAAAIQRQVFISLTTRPKPERMHIAQQVLELMPSVTKEFAETLLSRLGAAVTEAAWLNACGDNADEALTPEPKLLVTDNALASLYSFLLKVVQCPDSAGMDVGVIEPASVERPNTDDAAVADAPAHFDVEEAARSGDSAAGGDGPVDVSTLPMGRVTLNPLKAIPEQVRDAHAGYRSIRAAKIRRKFPRRKGLPEEGDVSVGSAVGQLPTEAAAISGGATTMESIGSAGSGSVMAREIGSAGGRVLFVDAAAHTDVAGAGAPLATSSEDVLDGTTGESGVAGHKVATVDHSVDMPPSSPDTTSHFEGGEVVHTDGANTPEDNPASAVASAQWADNPLTGSGVGLRNPRQRSQSMSSIDVPNRGSFPAMKAKDDSSLGLRSAGSEFPEVVSLHPHGPGDGSDVPPAAGAMGHGSRHDTVSAPVVYAADEMPTGADHAHADLAPVAEVHAGIMSDAVDAAVPVITGTAPQSVEATEGSLSIDDEGRPPVHARVESEVLDRDLVDGLEGRGAPKHHVVISAATGGVVDGPTDAAASGAVEMAATTGAAVTGVATDGASRRSTLDTTVPVEESPPADALGTVSAHAAVPESTESVPLGDSLGDTGSHVSGGAAGEVVEGSATADAPSGSSSDSVVNAHVHGDALSAVAPAGSDHTAGGDDSGAAPVTDHSPPVGAASSIAEPADVPSPSTVGSASFPDSGTDLAADGGDGASPPALPSAADAVVSESSSHSESIVGAPPPTPVHDAHVSSAGNGAHIAVDGASGSAGSGDEAPLVVHEDRGDHPSNIITGVEGSAIGAVAPIVGSSAVAAGTKRRGNTPPGTRPHPQRRTRKNMTNVVSATPSSTVGDVKLPSWRQQRRARAAKRARNLAATATATDVVSASEEPVVGDAAVVEDGTPDSWEAEADRLNAPAGAAAHMDGPTGAASGAHGVHRAGMAGDDRGDVSVDSTRSDNHGAVNAHDVDSPGLGPSVALTGPVPVEDDSLRVSGDPDLSGGAGPGAEPILGAATVPHDGTHHLHDGVSRSALPDLRGEAGHEVSESVGSDRPHPAGASAAGEVVSAGTGGAVVRSPIVDTTDVAAGSASASSVHGGDVVPTTGSLPTAIVSGSVVAGSPAGDVATDDAAPLVSADHSDPGAAADTGAIEGSSGSGALSPAAGFSGSAPVDLSVHTGTADSPVSTESSVAEHVDAARTGVDAADATGVVGSHPAYHVGGVGIAGATGTVVDPLRPATGDSGDIEHSSGLSHGSSLTPSSAADSTRSASVDPSVGEGTVSGAGAGGDADSHGGDAAPPVHTGAGGDDDGEKKKAVDGPPLPPIPADPMDPAAAGSILYREQSFADQLAKLSHDLSGVGYTATSAAAAVQLLAAFADLQLRIAEHLVVISAEQKRTDELIGTTLAATMTYVGYEEPPTVSAPAAGV